MSHASDSWDMKENYSSNQSNTTIDTLFYPVHFQDAQFAASNISGNFYESWKWVVVESKIKMSKQDSASLLLARPTLSWVEFKAMVKPHDTALADV